MATAPSTPQTSTAAPQAAPTAAAPPLEHDTAEMLQSDAHDVREENPPDRALHAGDIVSEWREGRDKVVEIQRGPGEDVEVVVIKNAYCPKDEKQTRRTLSPHAAAQKRQAFLARCSHAVQHAGQAVRDSVHGTRAVRDAP